MNGPKVRQLLWRDPHQLYQRLEAIVKDCVLEQKVKLIKLLKTQAKNPSLAQDFIQSKLSSGFWVQLSWTYVQLNQYETAPNLFNYTKTWHGIDCWFSWIYLFLPLLACCDHKIVLFWSAEQFCDHIMQELVKTGKFS